MTNNGFGFVPDGGIENLPSTGSNKQVPVLLIVDVTRSMEGQAISQVNYALRDLLDDLKNFSAQNAVTVMVSILSFASGIRWELTATDVNDVVDVPQMTTRAGLTCYGPVFKAIQENLRKGKLLPDSGKIAAPVLVLLTDGAPQDSYSTELENLKKHPYFAHSNRAAVIMGDAATDPQQNAAAMNAVKDFVSENRVFVSGTHTEIVDSIKVATLHTIHNKPGGNAEVPAQPPVPDPDPVPPFPPIPEPVPPTPDPDPVPPFPPISGNGLVPPFPDFPSIPDPNQPSPFPPM